MKIIVLGAGQVGSTVANSLAKENNDITVVDTNADVLNDLHNTLDIRTIQGSGSHPAILKDAGAEDADMIVAATNADEVNMVACQIAYSMFRTPTKIARIRSQGYLAEGAQLFKNDNIPVDVLISPERLVTDHIERIIEHPGALQVLDFADGLVRLVGVIVDENAPMNQRCLSVLQALLPDVECRVTAIYRNEKGFIPDGKTLVQAGDIVFFLSSRADTSAVMGQFRTVELPNRRVMIAGGGNIGSGLAHRLEGRYQVKIIEANKDRSELLAANLKRTLVFEGDAADHDLLISENIQDMDVFCALTNDDEANILSAMLARRMGAGKVMSLINRPAYVDLVERGFIDVAVSPQQVTIGSLLTHIRRGDVVAVYSLRKGAAEAIEAVAHGDETNSKVVGRRIEDLPLPPSAMIGALVRDGEMIIAHHDTVIASEDHIILLVVNKEHIRDVEKLFQVDVTFM
ncbi:MAG TPA: Trk system potassium transporter TrkA [Gammaproteobacteria bacterium]|nr:Trk system potassium transporter TrkA [Gammaproteobacteria bacterium]